MATPSAFSIEKVAEEVGGRLWFQLYACVIGVPGRSSTRAKDAGYEAILVTVDLPVSGKRERDPRNGFHTPYSPNWRNSKDVVFKPAWALDMLRNGLPGMANLEGYRFQRALRHRHRHGGRPRDGRRPRLGIHQSSCATSGPGKLLLKGVERADDAERAAAVGCDGVVVSNHGGRQLDGAAATLDALPEIGGPSEPHDRAAGRRRAPRRGHPESARARRASGAHRPRDALWRDGGRRAGARARSRSCRASWCARCSFAGFVGAEIGPHLFRVEVAHVLRRAEYPLERVVVALGERPRYMSLRTRRSRPSGTWKIMPTSVLAESCTREARTMRMS